jgi:leucyl aminopeptidase
MTTIKSIFFDIGETLGTAVLSPPPVRLVRVDLFPYVMALLRSLADRGLRLGLISNTGDMDGANVDAILNKAGIRDFFDASLRLYSKDVGLKKDSPEIFRVAAQRAGLAGMPQACLFVGEDETERGFAIDAGLQACPHPLLVNEVLDGHHAGS